MKISEAWKMTGDKKLPFVKRLVLTAQIKAVSSVLKFWGREK